MLRCANGHTNPESALFCATCLATMPPVDHVPRTALEAQPPMISWHSDGSGTADTGPESLDDVFGTPEEKAAPLEAVGAPQRRRKRRSHRWLPSLPHRGHHDRDVA